MTERLSPLDAIHRAAGATFTDFAGWQMPVRYSSDLAEHKAVRTAAGLFDLSHMGEIVVVGPEADRALDYALAGRLSASAEGQAKYTLLLARNGGVIDDLVVYRTGPDRYLVVANAANAAHVADELRARTAPFDCEVFDESDDMALIAVQGPKALEILTTTAGFGIQGDGNDHDDFVDAVSGMKYYRAVAAEFAEQPVLVARTGYTGEDGFELYVSPDQAPALWEALAEAGEPHGLVPAGLASRDTLRLEAGMPLYGHELARDTFPAQAGLGRVVVLSKEVDFVGRAASEEGPAADAPVLVGLASEGRRAGRAGYALFDGEGADASEAGVITSGALSPTLGHPIAMAYVAPRHAATGTTLYVDVRGTRIAASVVDLPFYRREK